MVQSSLEIPGQVVDRTCDVVLQLESALQWLRSMLADRYQTRRTMRAVVEVRTGKIPAVLRLLRR